MKGGRLAAPHRRNTRDAGCGQMASDMTRLCLFALGELRLNRSGEVRRFRSWTPYTSVQARKSCAYKRSMSSISTIPYGNLFATRAKKQKPNPQCQKPQMRCSPLCNVSNVQCKRRQRACQKEPSIVGCAIRLSHVASDEIQEHWKPWRWLTGWISKKPDEPEPCPQSPPTPAFVPGSKQ
jgi:hypothetical protein